VTVRSVVAFLKLGRPLFLGGGFILYALGAVIAAWTGHPLDRERYLLGQSAVTAFQWMTHYANDYFDYEADIANKTPTAWSGGSRVLVGGELPRHVALIAALVLAAIGIAVSVVVVREERAALPILAAMAVLAWAYSAPPARLCARGLGELNTAIVVTGLVPVLAFVLQAPDLDGLGTLLLAITPLALLQIAMLLAIELPDAAGDEATGKRTLIVRLGSDRGAQLYVAITTLAYLAIPIASLGGLPTRVVIAATLPVPLAAWRLSRIKDDANEAGFEHLTLFGVMLLMGTSIAELVAFASMVSW
jgi:1,4-dihydroxy-2-naphthoate octaprenyltransferase